MPANYEDFEQKKVQEVKGSFYIYLPKAWCTKYLVEKQKRVFLKQLDDDSLIVRYTPKSNQEVMNYTISLDWDEEKEKIEKGEYIDYLFNLYLTTYLIGYKTIIFKKRTKIPMELQNRITAMTRTLQGMTIISETKTEIVVEDTTTNFDIRIMIRQILNKVGLLIANLVEIVESISELTEDKIIEQIDQLITQDDQIDEHRYAIERNVHIILHYPSLAHDVGISTVECLHYSECTRLIERVGDYIIKIAKQLKKQKIKDLDFVLEHLNLAEGRYHTIQDYFDRTDSLKFFHLTREILKYADISKELINNGHPDKNFLSPIRRLQNICSDIAEIRINDILFRQQSKKGKKKSKKKK